MATCTDSFDRHGAGPARSAGTGLLRATFLASLAAFLLAATAAQAAPIAFTVDESQSSVDVTVTEGMLGTTGSDTVGVSGSSTADLALGGSPSLEVLSSSLDLDPFSILLDMGALGSVTIDGTNVVGDFFGGPTAGTALGSDTAEFDLAGYDLVLDEGTIDVSSEGFASGLVGDSTRDLSAEPLAFVLDSTLADVQRTDLGGGLEELSFFVPLDLDTTVDVSGQSADLTMQGQVVLTHTVSTVPEPTSAALLGLGLLGLARAGRRPQHAA